MAGKAPLNYTTTIDAAKTAGECTGMLARHGAKSVGLSYDQGDPCGLAFTIASPWGDRSFALPVNVVGTLRALEKGYAAGHVPRRQATPEQARRVAWRVLKDWLEAQLALIEAGVAELNEIMLPWMKVDPDRTLYQAYAEDQARALEAGRD